MGMRPAPDSVSKKKKTKKIERIERRKRKRKERDSYSRQKIRRT
jgi:hypothetical protein